MKRTSAVWLLSRETYCDPSGQGAETFQDGWGNSKQLIASAWQGKPSCTNNTNSVSNYLFTQWPAKYPAAAPSLAHRSPLSFCFCFVWATTEVQDEVQRFSCSLWFYQSLGVPSLFQYEIEHTCLLKVRGKKIAGVKNLITFIFFFHFFHPSSLEFERKGERKHRYCPKCVPWMLCAMGRKGKCRSKLVRSSTKSKLGQKNLKKWEHCSKKEKRSIKLVALEFSLSLSFFT